MYIFKRLSLVSKGMHTMKKTYFAPNAESIAFETEEILGISFTGIAGVLEEKTEADKNPASDFGNISLF